MPKQQRQRAASRLESRNTASASGAAGTGSENAATASGLPHWALVLAAVALGFAVYAPALSAPFFSDDLHYVEANAYIHTINVDNALAVWSPTSPVVGIVENYAPVHLTLHALAWQLFGADVVGHHVLGVLLHALVAVLLVGFFRRLAIAPPLALGLAAVFLVHPANVEAVAWISQLKTTSAMALMLVAIALQPGRPLAALGCFALALLAKPTAAAGLAVALLLQLQQYRASHPEAGWAQSLAAPGLRWLVAWLAVLGLFAVAEFAAFFETAGSAPPLYAELDVRLRSVVAVLLRYLVLAVSGLGVGVFHDPAGATSWLDPWFLGGVAWLCFVAWRCVVSLRNRSLEVVCWCFAAVSFAPIGGFISLPYPMADRYLYFMLPGLLGAAGLAASQRARRQFLERASRSFAVALVALIAVSGFAANRQAAQWKSAEALLSATEARYPAGKVAVLRGARRAALAGDVDDCVALLRAAMARGFDRLDTLVSDPAYRALRGRPAFDAIVDELAARLIARAEPGRDPSQAALRVRGQAQFVIGDREAALHSLQLAIERGGPYTEVIQAEYEQLTRFRAGGLPR